MIEAIVVFPSSESRRALVAANVFMIGGGFAVLLLRNVDGAGLIGRLGPTATTILGLAGLAGGAYLSAMAIAARRDGGRILVARQGHFEIQGALRRRCFDPNDIDGFVAEKWYGADRLQVIQQGRVVARSILQPADGSWREVAEMLNTL